MAAGTGLMVRSIAFAMRLEPCATYRGSSFETREGALLRMRQKRRI
jgi:hypothetical protein